MTEMTATGCANCGRAVEGTEQAFCPACGQPTPTRRIDMAFIREQLQRDVFSVDRGLLFTFRELLMRPGMMLRGYLAGRRAGHIKPMVLLMLSVALLLFVSHMAGGEPMSADAVREKSADQQKMREALVGWINANFALVTLVLLPIEAAAFKLAFRRFRDNNYAEWLVILAYLTAMTSLLWTALLLVQPWLGAAGFSLVVMLGVFTYMAYALLQFFAGHPRWTILWRFFAGMALYMVGYIVFLQLLALVFYGLMRAGWMAMPA